MSPTKQHIDSGALKEIVDLDSDKSQTIIKQGV